MVAVGELVEVDQRARLEVRLGPSQRRDSAGVQVAIDVDDELVMLGDLELRKRVVEPADLERDAVVIDLRWLAGGKVAGRKAGPPVLGQGLEAVEADPNHENTPPCRGRRAAPRASNTNTAAAAPWPTRPPGMCTAPKCSAVASPPPGSTLRPVGRAGHDQPALRFSAARVLDRRQRLLPPRPVFG